MRAVARRCDGAGCARATERFLAVASASVVAGAFDVVVPEGVPPTLFDGGEQAITWQARAGKKGE